MIAHSIIINRRGAWGAEMLVAHVEYRQSARHRVLACYLHNRVLASRSARRRRSRRPSGTVLQHLVVASISSDAQDRRAGGVLISIWISYLQLSYADTIHIMLGQEWWPTSVVLRCAQGGICLLIVGSICLSLGWPTWTGLESTVDGIGTVRIYKNSMPYK
jgi:hypothetical protein